MSQTPKKPNGSQLGWPAGDCCCESKSIVAQCAFETLHRTLTGGVRPNSYSASTISGHLIGSEDKDRLALLSLESQHVTTVIDIPGTSTITGGATQAISAVAAAPNYIVCLEPSNTTQAGRGIYRAFVYYKGDRIDEYSVDTGGLPNTVGNTIANSSVINLIGGETVFDGFVSKANELESTFWADDQPGAIQSIHPGSIIASGEHLVEQVGRKRVRLWWRGEMISEVSTSGQVSQVANYGRVSVLTDLANFYCLFEGRLIYQGETRLVTSTAGQCLYAWYDYLFIFEKRLDVDTPYSYGAIINHQTGTVEYQGACVNIFRIGTADFPSFDDSPYVIYWTEARRGRVYYEGELRYDDMLPCDGIIDNNSIRSAALETVIGGDSRSLLCSEPAIVEGTFNIYAFWEGVRYCYKDAVVDFVHGQDSLEVAESRSGEGSDTVSYCRSFFEGKEVWHGNTCGTATNAKGCYGWVTYPADPENDRVPYRKLVYKNAAIEDSVAEAVSVVPLVYGYGDYCLTNAYFGDPNGDPDEWAGHKWRVYYRGGMIEEFDYPGDFNPHQALFTGNQPTGLFILNIGSVLVDTGSPNLLPRYYFRVYLDGTFRYEMNWLGIQHSAYSITWRNNRRLLLAGDNDATKGHGPNYTTIIKSDGDRTILKYSAGGNLSRLPQRRGIDRTYFRPSDIIYGAGSPNAEQSGPTTIIKDTSIIYTTTNANLRISTVLWRIISLDGRFWVEEGEVVTPPNPESGNSVPLESNTDRLGKAYTLVSSSTRTYLYYRNALVFDTPLSNAVLSVSSENYAVISYALDSTHNRTELWCKGSLISTRPENVLPSGTTTLSGGPLSNFYYRIAFDQVCELYPNSGLDAGVSPSVVRHYEEGRVTIHKSSPDKAASIGIYSVVPSEDGSGADLYYFGKKFTSASIYASAGNYDCDQLPGRPLAYNPISEMPRYGIVDRDSRSSPRAVDIYWGDEYVTTFTAFYTSGVGIYVNFSAGLAPQGYLIELPGDRAGFYSDLKILYMGHVMATYDTYRDGYQSWYDTSYRLDPSAELFVFTRYGGSYANTRFVWNVKVYREGSLLYELDRLPNLSYEDGPVETMSCSGYYSHHLFYRPEVKSPFRAEVWRQEIRYKGDAVATNTDKSIRIQVEEYGLSDPVNGNTTSYGCIITTKHGDADLIVSQKSDWYCRGESLTTVDDYQFPQLCYGGIIVNPSRGSAIYYHKSTRVTTWTGSSVFYGSAAKAAVGTGYAGVGSHFIRADPNATPFTAEVWYCGESLDTLEFPQAVTFSASCFLYNYCVIAVPTDTVYPAIYTLNVYYKNAKIASYDQVGLRFNLDGISNIGIGTYVSNGDVLVVAIGDTQNGGTKTNPKPRFAVFIRGVPVWEGVPLRAQPYFTTVDSTTPVSNQPFFISHGETGRIVFKDEEKSVLVADQTYGLFRIKV